MGIGQLIGTVGGSLLGGTAGGAAGGALGAYLDGSGKKRSSGYGDIRNLLKARLADLDKRRKRRRGLYDPMEEKLAGDINQLLAGEDPARVTGAIARNISDIQPAFDQAGSRLSRQYAKMGRAGGNMTVNELGKLERGRSSEMLRTSNDVRNRAYQQALGVSTRGDMKDESLGYLNSLRGVESSIESEYDSNRANDLAFGNLLAKGASAGMEWWGGSGGGSTADLGGSSLDYGKAYDPYSGGSYGLDINMDLPGGGYNG